MNYLLITNVPANSSLRAVNSCYCMISYTVVVKCNFVIMFIQRVPGISAVNCTKNLKIVVNAFKQSYIDSLLTSVVGVCTVGPSLDYTMSSNCVFQSVELSEWEPVFPLQLPLVRTARTSFLYYVTAK